MLCLFQPPVQFRNLAETRRHRVQWGDRLLGLCCEGNKLYCVEQRLKDGDHGNWLTAYDVSGAKDGSLSLLDKVEVGELARGCLPRVDSSHLVYVQCGWSGVYIFRCQGGRLLPVRDPLRCVRYARSICVNTADTVFVCDWDTDSVCLVSVSSDRVIRRLERPAQIRGHPYHVSVLGQTVLVFYDYNNTLVTYRSNSPTPDHVLQALGGLGWVGGECNHRQSLLQFPYMPLGLCGCSR